MAVNYGKMGKFDMRQFASNYEEKTSENDTLKKLEKQIKELEDQIKETPNGPAKEKLQKRLEELVEMYKQIMDMRRGSIG